MKLPVDYDKLNYVERRSVREEYIKVQQGLCYFCKAPLDGEPDSKVADLKVTPRLFPKNFFKFPVHLHHNHATGMTIGAVHCYCNAVLWEHNGE